MFIQIRFYVKLREIIRRETLKLNLKRGSTVKEALNLLSSRYGKELKRRLSGQGNWVIMLNDKNIKFQKDLETPLKPGDQIAILTPLSGG
jgi:MoaD family protein